MGGGGFDYPRDRTGDDVDFKVVLEKFFYEFCLVVKDGEFGLNLVEKGLGPGTDGIYGKASVYLC